MLYPNHHEKVAKIQFFFTLRSWQAHTHAQQTKYFCETYLNNKEGQPGSNPFCPVSSPTKKWHKV